MEKSKAIELVKAGTHAIEMNRKEPQDVELLRGIMTKLSGNSRSLVKGSLNYYYLKNDFQLDASNINRTSNSIKITEIETDEEFFVNGEEVEVFSYNDSWFKAIYIGLTKDKKHVVTDDIDVWIPLNIRKLNSERTKAIEQIKELKEKYNINNDEI